MGAQAARDCDCDLVGANCNRLRGCPVPKVAGGVAWTGRNRHPGYHLDPALGNLVPPAVDQGFCQCIRRAPPRMLRCACRHVRNTRRRTARKQAYGQGRSIPSSSCPSLHPEAGSASVPRCSAPPRLPGPGPFRCPPSPPSSDLPAAELLLQISDHPNAISSMPMWNTHCLASH